MASKASFLDIASRPPVPSVAPVSVSAQSGSMEATDVDEILAMLAGVKPPVSMNTLIESVRQDLEPMFQSGSAGAVGFRRGVPAAPQQQQRVFQTNGWRGYGGNRQQQNQQHGYQHQQHQHQQNAYTPFGTSHTRQNATTSQTTAPSAPVGRYQSRFKKSDGNIQDKILNTIIGNKLNTFSPLTYNDVRDFIYQILDSGETEFIRDFVEKVFHKATQEDIYCELFAKLLSEISSRYPLIRTEMLSYHKEFLKVFQNVQEDKEVEYEVLVRQKQFRLGYGQFMSDLAALNTLEPECLYAMTETIVAQINTLTSQADKEKTVEEYIDCYVRMMKALRQKNMKFFEANKAELSAKTLPIIQPIIQKTAGDRPSLTTKARFGLMDLEDILRV